MQTVTIRDFENALRCSRATQTGSRTVNYRRLSDLNLPLVIEPVNSTLDLSQWLASHRQEVEAQLLESGGLLFRGFRVDSSEAFEKVICALSDRLLDYSYRSTPRSVVSGKVYTSTEYPPHQTIPLHNENAYARDWPMKIWFFSRLCAPSGGETPIADSRRVYYRIPSRIRERFERHGVTYVRNYGSGFDLPWEEVFQTASKKEVEKFCATSGIEVEWLSENRLRTRQTCQAVARHPKTGESVWFNQAHLFHVSRLPVEVREAVLTIFGEEDLPRNVYYGDGAPISAQDLDVIDEAYECEKVVFPWLEGDVMLLDNMLAAHARNPFVGKREVIVGMTDLQSESGAEN
jgi:alpha-ketoglutarate-dependent taurine dioxygenase